MLESISQYLSSQDVHKRQVIEVVETTTPDNTDNNCGVLLVSKTWLVSQWWLRTIFRCFSHLTGKEQGSV